MSFRSERFNDALPSLDAFVDRFEDPSKIAALSDRGKGVGLMLDEVEPTADDSSNHDQELAGAVLRLILANKKHLVATLLLISENGDNREESFAKVPRRSYFRQRDELLDFFVALECTYDLRGHDVGEGPIRHPANYAPCLQAYKPLANTYHPRRLAEPRSGRSAVCT